MGILASRYIWLASGLTSAMEWDSTGSICGRGVPICMLYGSGRLLDLASGCLSKMERAQDCMVHKCFHLPIFLFLQLQASLCVSQRSSIHVFFCVSMFFLHVVFIIWFTDGDLEANRFVQILNNNLSIIRQIRKQLQTLTYKFPIKNHKQPTKGEAEMILILVSRYNANSTSNLLIKNSSNSTS